MHQSSEKNKIKNAIKFYLFFPKSFRRRIIIELNTLRIKEIFSQENNILQNWLNVHRLKAQSEFYGKNNCYFPVNSIQKLIQTQLFAIKVLHKFYI